jgi:hypothetical protein
VLILRSLSSIDPLAQVSASFSTPSSPPPPPLQRIIIPSLQNRSPLSSTLTPSGSEDAVLRGAVAQGRDKTNITCLSAVIIIHTVTGAAGRCRTAVRRNLKSEMGSLEDNSFTPPLLEPELSAGTLGHWRGLPNLTAVE